MRERSRPLGYPVERHEDAASGVVAFKGPIRWLSCAGERRCVLGCACPTDEDHPAAADTHTMAPGCETCFSATTATNNPSGRVRAHRPLVHTRRREGPRSSAACLPSSASQARSCSLRWDRYRAPRRTRESTLRFSTVGSAQLAAALGEGKGGSSEALMGMLHGELSEAEQGGCHHMFSWPHRALRSTSAHQHGRNRRDSHTHHTQTRTQLFAAPKGTVHASIARRTWIHRGNLGSNIDSSSPLAVSAPHGCCGQRTRFAARSVRARRALFGGTGTGHRDGHARAPCVFPPSVHARSQQRIR